MCTALSAARTTTSCGNLAQLAVGRQLDPAGRRARGTGPDSASFSENGQVLTELPFGQLNPVLVPLPALQLDIAVEDVRAERLPRQFRLRQLVDRLAEGLGERHDAALAPLFGGQVIEVRLHRVGQLVALLDPLEARV